MAVVDLNLSNRAWLGHMKCEIGHWQPGRSKPDFRERWLDNCSKLKLNGTRKTTGAIIDDDVAVLS